MCPVEKTRDSTSNKAESKDICDCPLTSTRASWHESIHFHTHEYVQTYWTHTCIYTQRLRKKKGRKKKEGRKREKEERPRCGGDAFNLCTWKEEAGESRSLRPASLHSKFQAKCRVVRSVSTEDIHMHTYTHVYAHTCLHTHT